MCWLSMSVCYLQKETVELRYKGEVPSNSLRRTVWEAHMEGQYPLLSQVATRLLSMHATQCSTERNWPKWRAVCRYHRSRLGLEKAAQMIFISCMAAWRKGGDTTSEADAELVAKFAEEEIDDDLRHVTEAVGAALTAS